MKKILAVYNCCGLSGHENVSYYIDSIRSLLAQDIKREWGDSYQIAISGCCSSDGVQRSLQEIFKDHVSYNWIEEALPLSITFNDTVDQCVRTFGEFDSYLYIDSGINFWDPSCRNDAIKILYEVHKSGPYAITSAMPSNDDGRDWWGIKYKPGEDHIFKIGTTTNMHAQLFSNEWRQAYKHVLPDIFGSNCMESVFSGMAGALQRNFVMTQKVHLLHAHSMDGASLAARSPRPDMHPMSDMFETGGVFFRTLRKIDQMYIEGQPLGFGIEECKEYWRHDPEKFDSNQHAKDPLLKDFYAKHMYLTEEEFSYASIPRMFEPASEFDVK